MLLAASRSRPPGPGGRSCNRMAVALSMSKAVLLLAIASWVSIDPVSGCRVGCVLADRTWQSQGQAGRAGEHHRGEEDQVGGSGGGLPCELLRVAGERDE